MALIAFYLFLGPLLHLQLGRQTAGATATNKRTKAMDHHLTRPYKRASSTLSTAERGGQRRESQSVGNNAGGAASTHVGDGFSRNPSSDHHHHHHHHHASPARRAYPVAPTHSSSPYYGHDQYYSSSSNIDVNNHHFVSYAHGNGTAEEFKYARRRRERGSIGPTSHPTFLIFVTVILGSALLIYLRHSSNGGNDAHVSVPSQGKTTPPEQDTVIDDASKDTKLRGGMSKHERAAAALLLADIIVHAEHEAEEEILKGKFLASTTGTADAPRLGADDDDYFLLAGENSVPGAGYAYLPYEIDALDSSNLAVGVWIKPNKVSDKRNRVIWSTLDSGACGGASGSSTKDDIGGMELSIEGGQVTLRYISEDGSCQMVVGKQDMVQRGEWNHMGMAVLEDGRTNIFRNGNIIATGNSSSRAAHTHSDTIESPSHRPKGKMSRTFVGQRGDGTDGLDGRVAFLSIWASDARLDDKIIKNHYARTRRNSSMTDNQDDTSLGPTLMYPFNGESRDDVEMDSVSQLKETLKGRHGTVRRYVPVEQYSSSKNPQSKYSQYASGTYSPDITEKMKQESDALARSRRVHIKNAMKHAWEGYRTEAWGFDELLPLSAGSKDNWGGMAVTMIDSLSTLWLMDLKDEFYEARDFVQHELSFADVGVVSVFETTIRSLGGLLSAFDLSGERAFLEKADDLGARLSKSFDSPSGIPYGEAVINGVDAYNTPCHSSVAILSEAGTMQLEFRYLSAATGKKEYATKALNVIDELAKMQLKNGLFYLYIQNERKPPQWGNKKISLGAMGDSMYEYLLKLWLQGKKRETKYRRLYDRAMQGVHDELIKQNPASKLFYIGEQTNGKFEDKMDHLSCFTGGMLALGAATHPKGINSEIAQRDLKTAKSLAFTCYQMYKASVTGMAPEAVWFGKKGIEQRRHAIYSILRPETVETFFVLHQITSDPVYREWGWEIFLALEQFCKTDYAYGSLKDVNRETLDDKMESFALAETLKYLYLLQDPDSDVDILNKHVFTTEAHVFKI